MGDGAEENNIDSAHNQSWKKREGDLDGNLYHCILDSNLTDDMQNNAEHKGTPHAFAEFESHTSSLPSQKIGLKHESDDAITYTRSSQRQQETKMSDNATWMLREQQLEDVIRMRCSYVNFEKSNCSRPPIHWALHLRTVQVKGVLIHSNPNKFYGYITVPMRPRDVRSMMNFMDKQGR